MLGVVEENKGKVRFKNDFGAEKCRWMATPFIEMWNSGKGLCWTKFNFSYLIRDAFNIQVEMPSSDLGMWVDSTGKENSQGLSWFHLPFGMTFLFGTFLLYAQWCLCCPGIRTMTFQSSNSGAFPALDLLLPVCVFSINFLAFSQSHRSLFCAFQGEN